MKADEYREILKNCQSVFISQLCNGFLYDEELSGPGGAHFTLFVPPKTDRAEIVKAEIELKNHYDVTGLSVVRVPESILNEFIHTTGDKPKKGWIDSMRWIVLNQQCRKVDAEGNFIPKHKSGGQLCDVFTASRMVQIYDALNDKNRQKFHDMSFAVAHHIAMKV